MRRLRLIAVAAILLLSLATVAANAFWRHGSAQGVASSCGTGGVCAVPQAGQTFISWPDIATGATGDTWRYQAYESTSALNSGNCTTATKIGDFLANNSAQLFGGNPDSGGSTFTQAHRQDAALEMVGLSLAGPKYAANTGLEVRTIPSNRSAYYCIVAIDNPANSGGHSPTYIGDVGPVTEIAAAAVTPIQLRDSFNRTAFNASSFTITGTPTLQAVFILHASSASGGTCSLNAQLGDFWLMYGDPTMGWQDGTPIVFCSYQLHSATPDVIYTSYRDTRWATTFEGAMSPEAAHTGMGAIPSAQTRAAYGSDTNPHVYPFDAARLKRIIDFQVAHYNIGSNTLVLTGTSLGSWGTVQIGIRYYPSLFALCAGMGEQPRAYGQTPSAWPSIPSATPFGAALGTNAAAVTLQDGTTVWGGTGGYLDLPTAAQNATTDLCPMFFSNTRNDSFTPFADAIAMSDGYEAGKQFHVFAWNDGTHSNITSPMDAIWKQNGAATGGASNHAWSYDQAWFKTNEAIPVFSGFTVNDNPNVDTIGCRNCGWQWTVTADTSTHLAFSIQNNWMGRSPGSLQSGMETTGPVLGPFTTATANITVGRRAQAWHPAPASTVHCTNTPNGGSPSTQALTVDANGMATFIGAIVNSSGAGTMDCVP